MRSDSVSLYRAVLRELRISVPPPRRVNRTIIAHFRHCAESLAKDNDLGLRRDFENAINLLRAQREHNCLLERYNPLLDLTSQERVAATAHRVGLNMPETFQK